MTTALPPEPPVGSVVLRRISSGPFRWAWQRTAQGWGWVGGTSTSTWAGLHVAGTVEVIHEAPAPPPPEPPHDHLVRDSEGDLWEWDENESQWRTGSATRLDWSALARRYGPVTVYAPVQS